MNELEEDVSESDTVTFHDALSSEDDISELLLDDLECDWMRSGQLVNQSHNSTNVLKVAQ